MKTDYCRGNKIFEKGYQEGIHSRFFPFLAMDIFRKTLNPQPDCIFTGCIVADANNRQRQDCFPAADKTNRVFLTNNKMFHRSSGYSGWTLINVEEKNCNENG
jgi:hypothetical protein